MNRIMKTASYLAAPKLTFAARHPRKAAIAKAGQWALGRITPRRKPQTGRRALQGLGAAAVTIPLGLWLGRQMRGRDVEAHGIATS